MKNILITGINGFVGSSLAAKELEMGNNVIGIVRDINNKTQKDVLDKCTVIRGDILDGELMDRVVSDYEIDTIYHLAALSIVKIADKNPYSCYRSNIMGTVNILESVRKINKQIKVVIASSDKSYGIHDKLPYTEDMKLQPDDPYATSKACADLIAQSYFKTYGLNVNVIRCANIYGPRDMNLSRLIPNTILKILNNKKPQVYSGVLEFKREFIFIDDVCKAYHLLSNEGVPGEIYNIGDDEFVTIKETVELISDILNFDGGYEVMEKDFLEIPFQYMSADKLKSLGWRKVHSFREGLIKTISWYKKNK
jgi:CDP-glucose 4,6-dehydratase